MSIYEKAQNIIKKRQQLAQQKLREIHAVLMQDEAYVALRDAQKNLAFSDISPADFAFENEKLERKQNEFFQKFNADNVYFCTKCKDTGVKDGKSCQCFLQLVNALFYEELGLPSPVLFSFENARFDIFDEPETIKTLYNEIKNNTRFPQSIITFEGKTGTGKTHLAKCFANELIERGHGVLFLSSALLFDLSLNFSPNREQLQKILRTCDFLFIDDLGIERNTDFFIEFLTSLLSIRLECNKKTIITTNCSKKDIFDRYNERIFSRIFDKKNSLIFHLKNPDIRLTNNQ